MINLTLNSTVYPIKNRFDEITVKDFDFIINLSKSGNNEIEIRRQLLKAFSDLTDEMIDSLSVKSFEEVTSYLFTDGTEYTPTAKKVLGYSLPINSKGQIDLSVKTMKDLEKIMKSDSDEKTLMILVSIYNQGEYDGKLYDEISKDKASDYLWLVKDLEKITE